MKSSKKYLFAKFITFLSFQALFLTSVLACLCLPWGAQEQRDAATTVFIGKVVSIEKGLPHLVVDKYFPYVHLEGPYQMKTTFAVSEIWKGSVNQHFTVTSSTKGFCDLEEFKPEQEYLVYANGVVNDLVTGMCSGTCRRQYATEDLQQLGVGIKVHSQQTSSNLQSIWTKLTQFKEYIWK